MELMIIGLVGLLLFGKRLPSVMNSLGRSLTEFKRGMQDIDRIDAPDDRRAGTG
jgi:sec-independent protein translocase protein TatA